MKSLGITAGDPPQGDVTGVVEHIFRHESGRIISPLTRIFWVAHLNMSEDLVQEALARALQIWPYYGIPRNPSAWITQVSKNLALDMIRREKLFLNKESEIIHFFEQGSASFAEVGVLSSGDEICDDRLWMMFMCCYPLVPWDSQVALALKNLCGFSPGEIEMAFLTSEAAIAKRLTRAKQKIREADVPFELPTGRSLQSASAAFSRLFISFSMKDTKLRVERT